MCPVIPVLLEHPLFFFATAGVGWGASILTHHTLQEPLTQLSSGVLPTLLGALWVPCPSCPGAARPVPMCLVQP